MFKFLKKATRSILWRTGVGRKTAEMFWHNRSEGPGYHLLHYRRENVFANLPDDFDDAAYSKFIRQDSDKHTYEEEYVLAVDDVLLEPERLLGIRGFNELVEQTIVYKWDRQYPYILPYLLNRHKEQVIDEAILYDGSATRNYYHHFVDALSSLTILEKSGVRPDLPMLVNRVMYESPFFQYLLKRSAFFQNLNWRVVEADEWLRVRKLYKLKAVEFEPETWTRMRQLYELPELRPHRRVFLNRDRRKFGRYLTNEEEVTQMLAKYGFEMVLAENMSVEEQEKMFQETEYLVALTGMGLIQQFFMNPRYGHIIEIMPLNRLMPEYYWQGFKLGMKYYDVVVGGLMNDGKDYPVDLARLEQAVQYMLNNQSDQPVYGRTGRVGAQ